MHRFALAAALIPSLAVAAPIASPSDGPAILVDIEMNGATPWVAYSDADTRQIHVKKHDGSAWVEVGPVPSPALASMHLDLVFEANVPWILYSSGAGYTVARFDGTTWVREGKDGFGTDDIFGYVDLAFTGGVPHVVHHSSREDRADVYKPFVKENVHIWGGIDAMSAIPKDTEQCSAASDIGDDLYIAHHERAKGRLVVNKVIADGDKLEPVGKPYKGKGIANFLGLRADGRALYMAYEDSSNDYRPTFVTLDDKRKKWTPVATAPEGVGTSELDWTEKLALVWLADETTVRTTRWTGSGWTPIRDLGTSRNMGLSVASDLATTWVAFVDTSGGDVVEVRRIDAE